MSTPEIERCKPSFPYNAKNEELSGQVSIMCYGLSLVLEDLLEVLGFGLVYHRLDNSVGPGMCPHLVEE